MARSSHGTFALVLELGFGLLPVFAWMALDIGLRASGAKEPDALKNALSEEPEAARRLGLLARTAGWLLMLFIVYHAGWLFLPKLVDGSEPLRAWMSLRQSLGSWPHAIAHAVGLTALMVHIGASLPRLCIAFGWAQSAEARRAARASGLIIGVGFLLLYAQLVGWHAAGRGTIWSI